MAGGGCQGGISGLKVCDFEVPPRATGPCLRFALAHTKKPKKKQSKKTNFQGQKIPGRKVKHILLF